MTHAFNRRAATPFGLALLFALTACAGNTGSTVPRAPSQTAPGFSQTGARGEALTTVGVEPDTASCPAKFTAGCFTFSLSKGLTIGWCYGPPSDRCKNTKDYAWSGNVCLADAKKCAAIEQLKAKWTGPFKCTKKLCSSRGSYELDTITKGSKPPKVSKQYVYKQRIQACGNGACSNAYIGINVSR